tara:strand:+ start:511 stop:1386 length:876 start_codon:yes stop_codon:yes gene_type:complete
MSDFSTNRQLESRFNADGSENDKYVDLLDEDKPIAAQKFTCVSFISPEKILKQKELFMFEHFIKSWDFHKSLEKYNQFLNFLSFKYNLSFDNLAADLKEFVDSERDNIVTMKMEDEYKNFLDRTEDKLEKEFNAKHDFQTSIRGIKIRGSFPTQEEAELRAKVLRKVDPNHDVYVGPVGMWIPFHPEAYKTGKVEYMEETLNELMSEKEKNEEQAKNEFEYRVKETKRDAIAKNKKLAEETGNKITQTVDENGNLISIDNTNTQIETLGEDATVDDIKKELFEGDNIVPSK